MQIRVLSRASYRVMPWKNGLGATTEIAVSPAGADLDRFAWRVSIATVGANGPFSRFPGCDRIIVQLDGAPMVLDHEGSEHRLELLVPHAFPGDVETAARVVEAPAHDFNVVVRRGLARASVAVHRLDGGQSLTASSVSTGRTLLVHVLEGELTLGRHGPAVNTGDTLLATAAAAISLEAASRAVFLAVEIVDAAAA